MTAPDIELAYTRSADGPDTAGLLAFLRDEERNALDDGLNDERATAIDFYNGRPFGDEEEGRSQVVTRDVAEVVDYALTSLIGVMLSGDTAVEFDVGGDKNLGRIITAAVNDEFRQGQDGYRVLHDWIKAGLLEKSGTCKVCVEQVAPLRREAMVTPEEFAMMVEQGIDIIEADATESGEPFAVAWLEEQPPRFRDYVVPNEEFGVAADARDLDDDCVYSVYRMPRTVSQLVEMGFDVAGLGDDHDTDSGGLSMARDGDGKAQSWFSASRRTGANRRVWLLEEYARFDLNGDGVAELLKVHRVGGTILSIEPMDEQPGVVWCPFPMPARIVGQSLADKVMDIQRVRSVMLRQGLDNLYQSNAPRWLLPESAIGDSTIDDLLTTARPGGVTRFVGSVPPQPVSLPFVAQAAFDTMQIMAGEKESRTGITRLNQGLDPDALNRTATGTALMQASGQQMEDYMARNIAEAFARLMLKKYRLMRQWGRPMTVQVDGQEAQTDPRQWPDDARVQVRVGLGTGRKDQRLAHRMNLLQITQQAMAGGLNIFTPENVYNQIVGVIEDSALGAAAQFVTDPAGLPPIEDKPDPAMIRAQGEAQARAQQLQADQQQAQAENMLKARQQDADIAMAREKAAFDLQSMREKAALEAELAREGQAHEFQLALIRMQQERELAEMAHEAAEAPDTPEDTSEDTPEDTAAGMPDRLPKLRPGGALDE